MGVGVGVGVGLGVGVGVGGGHLDVRAGVDGGAPLPPLTDGMLLAPLLT